MVAFISSLAVLALAVPALAMPASNATAELSKRAISYPNFQNVNCEGLHYYQKSHVEAAAKKALAVLKTGGTVGWRNTWYPHEWYNREKFQYAANCQAKWYEFPIMSNHKDYNGGTNPLEDRIVLGSWNGADDIVLCGVMTHLNAPTVNGFKPCTLY
ncbi:unnamed protein product [Rhizoctonia solani]|uniref:Uncharacterized protein n=1 Tax=Rhizoctonia solani TaxID=456999 RepID=A0A8H3HZH4_9AGAM|nr:unnamed protein product [Rhizoctonia solani]